MGRVPNKKKFKLAKSMSSIINYDLETEIEIENINNSQASRSSDVLPVIKQVYIILVISIKVQKFFNCFSLAILKVVFS